MIPSASFLSGVVPLFPSLPIRSILVISSTVFLPNNLRFCNPCRISEQTACGETRHHCVYALRSTKHDAKHESMHGWLFRKLPRTNNLMSVPPGSNFKFI